MDKSIIKNINKSEILSLKDLVDYQEGQIVSKTLVQNDHVRITLFAYDKNEEIGLHTSTGDAMVQMLDGMARVTIGEKPFRLSVGDTIIMPADVPHAIYGTVRMKLLLTIVF